MHRIPVLIVVLCSVFVCACAQRIVQVRGEYTYTPPEYVTLERAKQVAIERAKIQALADEFGTVIAQNNSTFVSNDEKNSNTSLFSLGESEVKGEWLGDTQTPQIEIDYNQGVLTIKVKVFGKAREVVRSSLQINAQVLCNGTDKRFARTDFKDGDALYLLFKAPIDGYVCVYLVDEEQDVYCLLPYMRNKQGFQHITANKEYVFFSEEFAQTGDKIEQYMLNTTKEVEHNVLYVIFSPNEFAKAVDDAGNQENIPRQLSFSNFQKWLSRCRTHDIEMVVQKEILTIKNE